ncbi:MAG: hypothetical protein COB37_08305 [Kordiimonadales bacterium]|nr:MAG: hypothetical protein COB37_08305 [Kordiimonadales bacterium]
MPSPRSVFFTILSITAFFWASVTFGAEPSHGHEPAAHATTSMMGSERLLFSSEKTGNTLALHSMTRHGADPRLHVAWKVRRRGEYEAAVSPDGTKVAFTTYRYGGWKIAVANIDGSDVRRVTQDPQYAYDPHWAPDGKSLIYRRIVNNGAAYFRGKGDIFRINLDGSGNVNLSQSSEQHDRNPAYSPDGSEIVYDSFVGDELKIFLMQADGTGRRTIGGKGYLLAPSWSPDGTRIAHLRSDSDGYVDVWIMDKDGKNAHNLTNAKATGYKPFSDDLQHWMLETSWSQDGKTIAFVADYAELGNADIYTVSTAGGPATRLTIHKGNDLHPYWYMSPR